MENNNLEHNNQDPMKILIGLDPETSHLSSPERLDLAQQRGFELNEKLEAEINEILREEKLKHAEECQAALLAAANGPRFLIALNLFLSTKDPVREFAKGEIVRLCGEPETNNAASAYLNALSAVAVRVREQTA